MSKLDLAHFEQLYPQDTRLEEVEKILSFIKKGASCQIIGLPGTGKSNLLGLLSYNRSVSLKHLGENQKWFHFVYMDFSEVKKRNFFLSEVKNFEDDLILFQALKKSLDYLAIEKELTVVFLFDRFDQYTPNIGEGFFSNLKILRNRAKYRFSCVFSLNRYLTELVDPLVLSEFYEFVGDNKVFLKLMDEPGLTFRLRYLEKITGKKLDLKLHDKILELTAGHGKLTRLSWETVLSEPAQVKDLKKLLISRGSIG